MNMDLTFCGVTTDRTYQKEALSSCAHRRFCFESSTTTQLSSDYLKSGFMCVFWQGCLLIPLSIYEYIYIYISEQHVNIHNNLRLQHTFRKHLRHLKRHTTKRSQILLTLAYGFFFRIPTNINTKTTTTTKSKPHHLRAKHLELFWSTKNEEDLFYDSWDLFSKYYTCEIFLSLYIYI